MKTRRLAVAFTFFVLLVSGCSVKPEYRIHVDSLSIQAPAMTDAAKRFVLLPGNRNTSAADLQFKEFATYASRALAGRGYIPADGTEQADMAIFMSYGIGNPEEHIYPYSISMWDGSGINLPTTYGAMNRPGSYEAYSGTPRVGFYTTYFRFLVLDARDLTEYRKTKKEVQLWKMIVTSSGANDDLRIVVPYLIAAAAPYIGKNTGRRIEVDLEENDLAVLQLKGILPQQSIR